MNEVKRTLQLKLLRYATGRRKGFKPAPIHELLTQAAEAMPTIGERLFPGLDDKHQGELQRYYNRFSPVSKGVDFMYCVFQPGTRPLLMQQNLDAKNLDLSAERLTDPKTGKEREVVTVSHVLAYGQILIVESVRGIGGMQRLAQYLTYMARKVCEDHPTIHLIDVVGQDLLDVIERGDGVQELFMNLVHANHQTEAAFGTLLSPVRDKVGGAEILKVGWKTKQTLSAEDVLAAHAEAEANDALDKVVLHLKNGETVSGLDRYKVRTTTTVNGDGHGNPLSNEIRAEMRGYLVDLQTPTDGHRVLTDEGTLADI